MKWIDGTKRRNYATAKVGMFRLTAYVPKGDSSGGWWAVLDCVRHEGPSYVQKTTFAIGRPQGPYDSIETAKRAAVRSINTIIQAVKGDLLDDDEGEKTA